MRKEVVLTKKEILSELENLGVHSPSDIRSCLSEYKDYARQNDTSHLSEGNFAWRIKSVLKKKIGIAQKAWR